MVGTKLADIYTTARLAGDSGLSRSQVVLLTREGVLVPVPGFEHPGRGSSRIYSWRETAIARLSAELIKRFGVPIRELMKLATIFRSILAVPDEYGIREPLEARVVATSLDYLRSGFPKTESSFFDEIEKEFRLSPREASQYLEKAKRLKDANALFIGWWAELEDARRSKKRAYVWIDGTEPSLRMFSFFSELPSPVSYSPIGLVVDLERILLGLGDRLSSKGIHKQVTRRSAKLARIRDEITS